MTSSIEELVLPDAPASDGNMGMNANNSIVLKAATQVHIQVGGVNFTISSSGVNITGGQVTHNGRNIGSTHKHGDVEPGIGQTGTPT